MRLDYVQIIYSHMYPHKTHFELCPWTITPPSHPGTVLASSKNTLPEEPSSLLTHPDITLFRNTSGQ